jgi:hypothetical protein
MAQSNSSPYAASLEQILRKGLASNRGARELLNLIQFGDIAGAQTMSVSIPVASVKTLNATPVEVIAAPSDGRGIVITAVIAASSAGTAAYDATAGGKVLELRYMDASGGLMASVASNDADLNLDSVSAGSKSMTIAPAALVPGAKIVACMTTGEIFAVAGDKTVTLQVTFYKK